MTLCIMTPGANVIDLFLSVIYGFSYQATAFVRLSWKSLPGTNTLAYYNKFETYGQKSFIELAPDDASCYAEYNYAEYYYAEYNYA